MLIDVVLTDCLPSINHSHSLGGGLENTNIITVWNKVDVFDNADMVDRIRAEAASRLKTVAGTLPAIPLPRHAPPRHQYMRVA